MGNTGFKSRIFYFIEIKSFPSDDAEKRSEYLSLMEIEKKMDTAYSQLGFDYESIYAYV